MARKRRMKNKLQVDKMVYGCKANGSRFERGDTKWGGPFNAKPFPSFWAALSALPCVRGSRRALSLNLRETLVGENTCTASVVKIKEDNRMLIIV